MKIFIIWKTEKIKQNKTKNKQKKSIIETKSKSRNLIIFKITKEKRNVWRVAQNEEYKFL